MNWQRVRAADHPLVESAYDVLSNHDSPWHSAAELASWLAHSSDRLYLLIDEALSLVVGFRHERGGQWQISAAGVKGPLSVEASRILVEKIVAFAAERAANSVTIRLPQSHFAGAIASLWQLIGPIARGLSPAVKLSEQSSRRLRQLTLTFDEAGTRPT